MARLHKVSKPLDNAKIQELEQDLKNLQGNILRGHGRDHAVHLFLTFKQDEKDLREIKRWMRETIAGHVTSTTQQRNDAIAYNKGKTSSEDLFCSFFLSASGYDILHIKPPDDTAFQKGFWERWKELYMHANKASNLDDSRIYNDWYDHRFNKHKNPNIHAMLILASDHGIPYLEEKIKNFIDDSVIDSYFTEEGSVERRGTDKKDRKTFDHFGFRDNISQPLFFTEDLDKVEGGTSKWIPGAGPNLVLVQDPHAPEGADKEHAHGSYLVFLKLEQHVDVFQAYPGDKAEFIGREEDGTPLLNRKKKKNLSGLNNFNYFREAREPGSQELEPEPLPPFSSHIRRMNPRGEYAVSQRMPSTYDHRRRILRRGIPYEDRSSSEKGLLFMCYQADIAKQFEYLLQTAQQSNYVTEDYIHRNFKTYNNGTESVKCDAIIGRLIEIEGVKYTLPRFVTLRGGEYFFAPSIPFLKALH